MKAAWQQSRVTAEMMMAHREEALSMGIAVGGTFRLRLLVACFFAVALLGSWGFAAEEAAPAKESAESKVDKDVTPSADEIAKRDARAEDYKTLGEKFFRFPVTGSLYTSYTVQRATAVKGSSDRGNPDTATAVRPTRDSESDQDIHQYLTMDFGDRNRHVAVGHFDISVDHDLDGYNARKDFDLEVERRDPFLSIADTFERPTHVRLDSAYVDFNHLPGVGLLRVGRQLTYETPEVLGFDGVRLDTQTFFGDRELVFSFYGGRSVHNYELTGNNYT